MTNSSRWRTPAYTSAIDTGDHARKSPAASRSRTHATTRAFPRSHSITTSLSSRHFGIPASSPPLGPPRGAQLAEPAPAVDVVPVLPDSGQTVGDGSAVRCHLRPVPCRDRIPHEPRNGGAAPPALGGEQA